MCSSDLVVCLQELKAEPEQIPASLATLDGYWTHWHGTRAYSGVGLLVSRSFASSPPTFDHPPFDFETRIATARIGDLVVGSVYVPNGGKDYDAKLRFVDALIAFGGGLHEAGLPVVLCGDLNITRDDIDVHPKERKVNAIGQRPEERTRLASLLDQGLVDLGRALGLNVYDADAKRTPVEANAYPHRNGALLGTVEFAPGIGR